MRPNEYVAAILILIAGAVMAIVYAMDSLSNTISGICLLTMLLSVVYIWVSSKIKDKR